MPIWIGNGVQAVPPDPPHPAINNGWLTFEPEHHTIRIDGHRVPSVSRLLRAAGLAADYSQIDPAVLEKARARGVAGHAIAEQRDHGESPFISEEMTGYAAADAAWRRDTQWEAIQSEYLVGHREWGYGGIVDAVGWHGAFRVLVDRKLSATYDACATSVQLAAYKAAWEAMHPAELIDQCVGVHLRADGSYVQHLVHLESAHQALLAALTIWRFKREHRK